MRHRALVAGAAAVAVVSIAGCAATGPQVIVLGSGPQEDRAAAALMPVEPVQYVLAAQLPALDSSAAAYRASGNAATQEAAQQVADALGLPGPVARADWGTAWVAGEQQTSGASLTVNDGPLGEWWYGEAVAIACAEPAGGSSASADIKPTTDPCQSPTPPADLPSSDRAAADAAALMTRTGGWTGGPPQVARDDYGVTVSFPTSLDGVVTPYTPSVRYGAGGTVVSANGYLAGFSRAEDYPRIGTAAAFQRLQDGKAMPWGAMMAEDTLAVGGPDAVGSSSGGSGEASSGRSGETSQAIPPAESPVAPAVPDDPEPQPVPPDTDPSAVPPDTGSTSPAPVPSAVPSGPDAAVPPQPIPTPEPVIVRITGVAAGLWSVTDADGVVWLLPSYVFQTADGGQYPVVAVPEDLIRLPSPQPVPLPAVPKGEPAQSGGGSSGSSGGSTSAPNAGTAPDAAGVTQ